MAVKRPRPRDLASIGLLASLGCYLLLASPRDALPDGTSQRRALVASAPPSSDIIQDEYIVTIKPFAYAYDRAVGSCSASPSGTFYGVFQNLDECEDITINIISDHYPDEISWVLHAANLTLADAVATRFFCQCVCCLGCDRTAATGSSWHTKPLSIRSASVCFTTSLHSFDQVLPDQLLQIDQEI